jgi:hypothetical protein
MHLVLSDARVARLYRKHHCRPYSPRHHTLSVSLWLQQRDRVDVDMIFDTWQLNYMEEIQRLHDSYSTGLSEVVA